MIHGILHGSNSPLNHVSICFNDFCHPTMGNPRPPRVAWTTWTRTRDNLYQSVHCGINSKQYNLHQLVSFFSRSSCNHCNRILNWKMLIDAHRCSISMWIRLFEINPVEVSRTLSITAVQVAVTASKMFQISRKNASFIPILATWWSNVIHASESSESSEVIAVQLCSLQPSNVGGQGGVQQDESQETFKLFEWTSTKENPGCQRYVQSTNEYKVNLASQSP